MFREFFFNHYTRIFFNTPNGTTLSNIAISRAGGLATSDRIVEVAGVKLHSADHEQAVAAIQGAPSDIVFMVQSLQSLVSKVVHHCSPED